MNLIFFHVGYWSPKIFSPGVIIIYQTIGADPDYASNRSDPLWVHTYRHTDLMRSVPVKWDLTLLHSGNFPLPSYFVTSNFILLKLSAMIWAEVTFFFYWLQVTDNKQDERITICLTRSLSLSHTRTRTK